MTASDLKQPLMNWRAIARSALASIYALAFSTALSQSAIPMSQEWDVLPTPLRTMEEAGVTLDVESISARMSDRDQDPWLRWRAALALGQLGAESAIPSLLRALVDPEVMVRAGAAAALKYLPRRDLASPLCKTAMYDVDEAPRHNAVLALGMIKSGEAISCLETVIADEEETAKIREFAAVVLGQHLERLNDLSDR